MNANQIIANRFEIADLEKDLLGQGGMGNVYRGADTQTGRAVAVKVLKPDLVASDPDLVARFVREGEALRQLNHPNIVQMVAAVEEEGQHYLVMEYVEGGSLRDLVEAEGALPIARVLDITLDLADALTRAHRLNIIHRDLKPGNVLLAEDGTPRLTDFGVAQVADSPRLTQTGALVGTVGYLSPEACNGETLDNRADIWAVGVMVYEMLTGELPFLGDTLIAVITAILTQSVPDLAQLRPDIPDALIDLVYRMLEKDRFQRVPSVRLVGAELEAILHERELTSLTPHSVLAVRSMTGRFATPTPASVTDLPKHNLPVQPTPFVGREAELTELARLLVDPDVRLLTILGAGGMGKTRLALEAAEAQLNNFERGVYFVSLAPLQSVEAIMPTVAEALGFSFYEGGEPKRQLLDYLHQKAMLILMDNFEHLLDGVGLVTEILQTALDVKILATSRARLNVQGEHLFHLAGMDFPDWETPEDALEYSAVKLFLQSARRARPGFELEADDLKYISRICRLVGGMPLGILLAAAWVEMLSPEEIATEIGQSLDFLETDLRDVPERQRSMRAVFDYSWRLLNEREQEVFQALSVFRGGFTREAAKEVAGASLRELMTLVSKSLLSRTPTGRYQVHELARQHAAEKLEEVPAEEEAARDRHCVYYAEFLRGREEQLIGKGQRQALAEIGAEIENVRAGWDWAVAQGKVEEMNHCLDSLAEFYCIRAWSQEGEETFARAAQRLAEVQEENGDRTSKMVLGKVLLQQGRFCDFLGLVEKASELLQSSLAIFRDLGARREMAYALYHLGGVVFRLGEEKSLYQEGLVIFKEIGDQRGVALSLRGLGWVATRHGEYGAAKQLLQESLALFRELGNQEGTAQSLAELGYVSWLLGEYMLAKQLHQESLALCREIGNQTGVADTLNFLAIDASGLGEYENAKRLYQESLAIFKEIGNPLGMAWTLADSAETANVLGEYTEAIQPAQESLALFKTLDHPRGMANCFRILGNAAYGLGDSPGAKRQFHQALRMAKPAQGIPFVLLALVGIATLLTARGEKERALELLALVRHHSASWQWAKDRAAPLVAELEAELSPEIVAAVQKRGRARDLEATVAELLVELGEEQDAS